MSVCMSGYAFRHALRYRAETWHGVGDGPTKFVGIFSKPPHPGSICLRNAVLLQKFGEKNPLPERSAPAGVKGHAGVTWG